LYVIGLPTEPLDGGVIVLLKLPPSSHKIIVSPALKVEELWLATLRVFPIVPQGPGAGGGFPEDAVPSDRM